MIAKNVANNSQPVVQAVKRLLKVALIGAPNAGKSTILNKLVMTDISCVSNKVHTTRKNVLGVYTENDAQLEFYDSPGLVTRQHVLKHHLEDSLLNDPAIASQRCDLIAVVVDASNPRGTRRLDKGISKILQDHDDKKSCLILNKVDLVKEKRLLLDIGLRLSEGHLNGRCLLDKAQLSKLLLHRQDAPIKTSSPFVIELNKDSSDNQEIHRPLGYRNFTQIFSISATQDDGIDELRENLLSLAEPVETWPHGPEYLSNQTTKEIVHSTIRGNVMDSVDHEIPYVIKYKYLQCKYDDLGSLHIDLELLVPKRYMVGKLLGQHGIVIFKIINESREKISTLLACDVKLNITVNTNEAK